MVYKTLINNQLSLEKNNSNLLNIYAIIKSRIYNGKNMLSYCQLSIKSMSNLLDISPNTILKTISILENLNLIYVYRFENYIKQNGQISKYNNAYSIIKYEEDIIKKEILDKIKYKKEESI